MTSILNEDFQNQLGNETVSAPLKTASPTISSAAAGEQITNKGGDIIPPTNNPTVTAAKFLADRLERAKSSEMQEILDTPLGKRLRNLFVSSSVQSGNTLSRNSLPSLMEGVFDTIESDKINWTEEAQDSTVILADIQNLNYTKPLWNESIDPKFSGQPTLDQSSTSTKRTIYGQHFERYCNTFPRTRACLNNQTTLIYKGNDG